MSIGSPPARQPFIVRFVDMTTLSPQNIPITRRDWIALTWLGGALSLMTASLARAAKPTTPPPTKPPLQPADIARLPAGMERLDFYLLIGQSNMKGRGFMPDEPKRDPRIVMMHLKDDAWYLARHPLHLTGDPKTFAQADNAGVGSGLAFAEAVLARRPKARVGLLPCAVGGTQIASWQRGADLYDNAVRRAKVALKASAPAKPRLRAALWLQGEADATNERRPVYEEKLHKLVGDLRADLGEPQLPFLACTIGEMVPENQERRNPDINKILLSLPQKIPGTACVDARDLKTHIGDNVHFDTPAQEEIGRRFAAKFLAMNG